MAATLRKCRVVLAAALITGISLPSCALRRSQVRDYGIPACPAGSERDLLSSDALQCWFDGAHGRWRMLGHQSHLQALVVEAEAHDLRDAEAIARLLVDGQSVGGFSEILLYVRTEAEHGVTRLRRVQWTGRTGFQTLDFSSLDGDAPLTVRSKS